MGKPLTEYFEKNAFVNLFELREELQRDIKDAAASDSDDEAEGEEGKKAEGEEGKKDEKSKDKKSAKDGGKADSAAKPADDDDAAKKKKKAKRVVTEWAWEDFHSPLTKAQKERQVEVEHNFVNFYPMIRKIKIALFMDAARHLKLEK